MKNYCLKFLMLLILIFIAGCKKKNNNEEKIDKVGDIVAKLQLSYTRDVLIYGNYAFVSRKVEGISIIDISNPKAPTVVKTIIPGGIPPGEARKLFLHDKRLYCASYNGGYTVFNISSPTNPQYLFGYNILVNDIYANDNYIFTAGAVGSDGQINIWNIDGTNVLGEYINSDQSETDRGYQSIWVVGNYIYAGTNGGYFHVLDFSNINNIQRVGKYYNAGSIGHNPWVLELYVENNIAYLADWGAGLVLVDVSNPTNPSLMSAFTGGSDGPEAYDVVVKSGIAYIANGHGGLTVVDVSNPTNPTYLFETNISNTIYHGVDLYGDYAVTCDNGIEQGIAVIKIK